MLLKLASLQDHAVLEHEGRMVTRPVFLPGDSLSGHNLMKFTTFDNDLDTWDKNCAQHFLGGFWYGACHSANPTGMYAPHGAVGFDNVQVIWKTWKGYNYSLKTIVMKIRPIKKCSCTD